MHQPVKYWHWYGLQIAAQIRDDDPKRQEKLAFALEWIPEPMDQADAESPEGRDPEDPHYRWPDDISELEESSYALPLPGDQSRDAVEHRVRKAGRHERNQKK